MGELLGAGQRDGSPGPAHRGARGPVIQQVEVRLALAQIQPVRDLLLAHVVKGPRRPGLERHLPLLPLRYREVRVKPRPEGHRILPAVLEEHADLQLLSAERVGVGRREIEGVAGQGALVGGQAQRGRRPLLCPLVDHRPGEVPREPVLRQAPPPAPAGPPVLPELARRREEHRVPSPDVLLQGQQGGLIHEQCFVPPDLEGGQQSSPGRSQSRGGLGVLVREAEALK